MLLQCVHQCLKPCWRIPKLLAQIQEAKPPPASCSQNWRWLLAVWGGKVDLKKPITEYVTELKGTVWDDVSTYAVANMTTGLDNEETVEALLQPDSPVTRFLATTLGSPRATTGVVEGWIDVARDQKKLGNGEKPGDVTRYTDRYGRMVARCSVRGADIGQWLVSQGWAMAYTRYSKAYVTDEQQARTAKRGIWVGTFQPPWEWRRAN